MPAGCVSSFAETGSQRTAREPPRSLGYRRDGTRSRGQSNAVTWLGAARYTKNKMALGRISLLRDATDHGRVPFGHRCHKRFAHTGHKRSLEVGPVSRN